MTVDAQNSPGDPRRDGSATAAPSTTVTPLDDPGLELTPIGELIAEHRSDDAGVENDADEADDRSNGRALPAVLRRLDATRFGSYWRPIAMYLAARLFITTVWLVGSERGYRNSSSVWDAYWYWTVGFDGYSLDTPAGNSPGEANVAFFPAYPLVSRIVHEITGLSAYASMHLVSTAAGVLATCMLWALVRQYYDRRRADLTTLLFAFSTGAFALSMLYSEGLFLVAAIGCCWLLMRERYLAAGLLAALGTATRPTGVVLVAVCAVAALSAPRADRLRAWAATAIAPLGIIAFFVYLRSMSGSWTVYFDVQRAGWGDGTSPYRGRWNEFGAIIDTVRNGAPLEMSSMTSLFGLVIVAFGIMALVQQRTHRILLAYTIVMFAMLWSSEVVGFRPRMIMVIFPIFIGISGRLPSRRAYVATLAASAGFAAAFAWIYLTGRYIIP